MNRPKQKSPAILQRQCDEFNSKHPVGTLVRFYPVLGGETCLTRKTKAPAQVLSGHSAVIWLEYNMGCVALDHCFPVNDAPIPEPREKDAFAGDGYAEDSRS